MGSFIRIAVVTPHYHTPAEWLRQCRASVRTQTVSCTHFLIADGDEPESAPPEEPVRVVHLPGPHGDAGNAARAAGSVLAACEGYDAIGYLDADNWYAPDHLESLLELHHQTGAAVCTSGRWLHRIDGSPLGPCPEVDGVQFADTNCLLLFRSAFEAFAGWYLAPASHAVVADRLVWQRVFQLGLQRAHSGRATVAYRTRYRVHYEHFGEKPPDGCRVIAWDAHQRAYVIHED